MVALSSISVSFIAGTDIRDAISLSRTISKAHGCAVQFTFNEVQMKISGLYPTDHYYRYYCNHVKGCSLMKKRKSVYTLGQKLLFLCAFLVAILIIELLYILLR